MEYKRKVHLKLSIFIKHLALAESDDSCLKNLTSKIAHPHEKDRFEISDIYFLIFRTKAIYVSV